MNVDLDYSPLETIHRSQGDHIRWWFILGGIVLLHITFNIIPGGAEEGGSRRTKGWQEELLAPFFISREEAKAVGLPGLEIPLNISFLSGWGAFLGYCGFLIWYKKLRFRLQHLLLFQLLIATTLTFRMLSGIGEMCITFDAIFVVVVFKIISQRYLNKKPAKQP